MIEIYKQDFEAAFKECEEPSQYVDVRNQCDELVLTLHSMNQGIIENYGNDYDDAFQDKIGECLVYLEQLSDECDKCANDLDPDMESTWRE